MVAGFDKTFEIGRQFRNEGFSREHLQDYTQMEFYWAYASYFESMQLVEELYKHIAQETFGTLEFEIAGHKVDLSAPWERIDFTQTIKQNLGIDISVATNEEVKQKLTNLHIDFDPKDERGRLLDLLWKHVRKSVSGPAFLVGHPVEVSPLAKRQKNNPNFVERYQVILAGSENGNGYSELNDPVDQQQRFEAQQAMREAGDTEAQMDDSDFVAALEYGMPPVSGFGVSERLFSFLANQPIRECVLFPLLRPETTANTSKFIQDFDQKLVIVINPSLPNWQIMNTSGHIAAFLGNKMSAKFDTGSHFVTKDGTALPRNTQYPIVTLSATAAELKSLMSDVRNTNLLHIGYTSEMMETTDDKKISELIGSKTDDQVTFAGVGIFGSKHEIDTLTKKFPLWK
jgi:lysyl-tRNA synthetase class 2